MNIFEKKTLILFIFLSSLFCIRAQSPSVHYQFKGVGDKFVDEYSTDIIIDEIKKSQLQVTETIEYVLTYEQKTLKMSYSAEISKVTGIEKQENADLYADLEDFVRKTVVKSLEKLEETIHLQEVSLASKGSEVATDENVTPKKTEVSPNNASSKKNVGAKNDDSPKAETAAPVHNESKESVISNDTPSQNKFKDKGGTWQKIRNAIMKLRNKSDKIVSLKTSGKLSTFMTLKSGLMAELTDEGILKISGTGRMLTEDEALLKSLRTYVVAIELEEGITDVLGFQQFASVEYVLLPSTVRRIAPSAFKDCIKLMSINIPEATSEIGSAAFQNCEMLSALVLPNGLSSIGDKAFFGCKKMKEINIPSSLSIIAESVFRNCQSIENIEIPSSVTQIKENAFKNCRSISKLDLTDNVVFIEKGCFQDMKMLTDVRLSEKLTSIPSGAFESCSSLSNIKLPSSVLVVGEYAFKDCESLVEITLLSNKMQSIGKSCFEDCKKLSRIYLYSQYPPVCVDMFDDKVLPKQVIILVPKSAELLYKNTEYWKSLIIMSM